MRKHPVLLLELMISFALFGVLMVFLFSSYQDLVHSKTLLRKDKERILNHQRLQLRLSQIFSKLEKITSEKKAYLMTFDNGLDLQADFRGVTDGLLYIDKQKRLTLITWPQEETKSPGRREVLIENIDEFECGFLDLERAVIDEVYPKEKPTMMKITLNKKISLPLIL